MQDELKAKTRRTCENYSKIKIPYKYVIDNLYYRQTVLQPCER